MAGFIDRLLFDPNPLNDYTENFPLPDWVWRPSPGRAAAHIGDRRMTMPPPNIGDREMDVMGSGDFRNIKGDVQDFGGKFPVFLITTPSGAEYEVEGPDEQTAVATLKKLLGPQSTPSPKEKPSMLADIAKSAGIGLAKGAIGLAGLPGDIKAGENWLLDKILGPIPADAPRPSFDLSPPSTSAIQKAIEGVTGPFYQPQTTAGEYARTAAEFVPGALALPGGAAARAANAIRYGAIPGIASEAAGQATQGTAAEPWARALGGVGGALAAPAIANLPRRIISPLPIAAERAPLVEALQREGIPLTAGQATGSKPLAWAESALSDMPFAGGRAAAIQEAQGKAFTQAALRRAGVEGELATPETMATGKESLGARFEALSERNVLQPDNKFAKDLDKALSDYQDVTAQSARAPGVEKIVRDLKTSEAKAAAVAEEIPFELPDKKGPDPTSLVGFLQRTGIQDEGGDLASMGFTRFPGLVRPRNGVPMDEARRRAVEAGYLEPHETVSDFINKIGDHPTYSVHDQEAIARREAQEAAAMEADRGAPATFEPGASDMFPGDTKDLLDAAFTREPIPGTAYQAMRSRLTNQANSLRVSDPPQAQAYRAVRDALDNAMERSIKANNPRDAGAWTKARRQYANYKAIEKAASGAGEATAAGYISPSRLRSALAAGNRRADYVIGKSDLAELARAGEGVMKPLPQSGTAPRMYTQRLLELAGAGGGALAGGAPGLAGGLAAAIATPAIAGRALMSRPVQRYLKNQIVTKFGTFPRTEAGYRALYRALAATMAARQSITGREERQ